MIVFTSLITSLIEFENKIYKIYIFTKVLFLIFHFLHGHEINVVGLVNTN